MGRIHFSLKKCIVFLWWLSITVLFVFFICEYLVYYIVIRQCSWPKVNTKMLDESNVGINSSHVLKAMFIADTHLLGPYRGHWFDKLWREWQMYRAFQTSIFLYNPEVVFVLGDLFDEGMWCNDKQFTEYVNRFKSLFEVPPNVQLYVVPGNHDLGFHYSMAMHGDGCTLCHNAEVELRKITRILNCLKKGKKCESITNLKRYHRPIVLQHFPMYRKSDEMCTSRDAAPPEIKSISFREKWDSLSESASNLIYDLLNPSLILSGHTHHGCRVLHREDIYEHTLPSFNWRNKNNPTFTLGVFYPDNYVLTKCDIPRETTVILLYFLIVNLISAYLICNVCWGRLKKNPESRAQYFFFWRYFRRD